MEKSKTSGELKRLIEAKEKELANDKKFINAYFQQTNTQQAPYSFLKDIIKGVAISPGIKAEIIKTVVSYIVGFVIKKLVVKKKPESEKTDELSILFVEAAIAKVIDNNSAQLTPAEKEVFKKLMYKQIIAK